VVESYALLLASLLLAAAPSATGYGRRRVFLLGVLVFAHRLAGLRALADRAPAHCRARAARPGGGLLVPGSLALISLVFRRRSAARPSAPGRHSAASPPALGPLVGGWLIDHFSWAWAFALNIPLALLVLGISWLHVPESRATRTRKSLDWPGALLATLGLGGIVFAFIEAPARHGAPAVLGALALGVAALGPSSWWSGAGARPCCRWRCCATATSPAPTC
jgi:MFS family permease